MRYFHVLVVLVVVLLSFASAHASAPVWTVRDIDQFQDNFASDGTITGFVRADMANDILPASSPGILPGDSSVVVVTETDAGLATDPLVSGDAVYCYVTVVPNPYSMAGKSGAALSGGARWPFVDTQVINSRTWTRLRFDQSIVGGNPLPGNYCIDLNDNLFTPGDTIYFFYSAKSADVPGTTNYFSLEIGTTSDITVAAAFAMEFTCLPAGGFNRGGDELYVDAAESGVQEYWDSMLRIVHHANKVDRYDVRGAADGANNRLASRVVNFPNQLNSCYRMIYWDCGSLSITLGDGSGTPQKTNDYGLMNNFLNGLTNNGGIALFGDDIADQLTSYSSPDAMYFMSTFMPFTLVSGDHAPTYGLAPTVTAWPGRCIVDNFVAYGAGPPVKDFDVLQPGATSRMEASYGPNAATNGAVVTNSTINGNGKLAGVALCGFSFADVRDDDNNGLSDRAKFFRDISLCVGNSPFAQVTTVGPSPNSSLVQNHPNPFNPQTTIAFSLAARGRVSLAIYDVNGRIVRTLANETRAAGAYELKWDGRDDDGQAVASGVYFYRLVAPDFTQTKKMVLLK